MSDENYQHRRKDTKECEKEIIVCRFTTYTLIVTLFYLHIFFFRLCLVFAVRHTNLIVFAITKLHPCESHMWCLIFDLLCD